MSKFFRCLIENMKGFGKTSRVQSRCRWRCCIYHWSIMAESSNRNNPGNAGNFCRYLLEPVLLQEATIRQRPIGCLTFNFQQWPLLNKAYL